MASGPGFAGDDLVETGKEVFQVTAGGVGCQACHGEDAAGLIGPDIRGMNVKAVKAALSGITDMQFIELTDQEVEAAAAYLATLIKP